ncbi:MAG: HigA family addiction module antitoxin [Gammaproteobacteria bacterium]
MTDTAVPFRPDWVSPPGETIADLLEERGWSQADLASRLGYSTKHVSQLINGKVPLTEDTALRLERVLGSTAGFWLAREAEYQARRMRLAAEQSYANWTGWLDQLPVRELMKTEAISKRRLDAQNKPTIVEELLRFFGVASPDEWKTCYANVQAAYRRTREEQCDAGAISAWLRLGEVQAEKIDTPDYNPHRFKKALAGIRALTTKPAEKFRPGMFELCRDAGVTLVLVPAIPRAHVSGVARWLSAGRPLIQLSLYGKYNDRFWFTFFHEAAHILLHGKKEVFLDDFGGETIESQQEQEANDWAGNFLIPEEQAEFLRYLTTADAVLEFAHRIGIHPGIVVGRLQHDGVIPHSRLNNLKVRFEFVQ